MTSIRIATVYPRLIPNAGRKTVKIKRSEYESSSGIERHQRLCGLLSKTNVPPRSVTHLEGMVNNEILDSVMVALRQLIVRWHGREFSY